MTAKVILAIRETEALDRIQAAVEKIAASYGVLIQDAMPTAKDADIQRVVRFEFIADQLDGIVQELAKPAPAKKAASK